MRKIRFIFCVTLISALLVCSSSSFAATLSPALSVISHSLQINTSCLNGNGISFSKDFFKNELQTELLGHIRVLSLPDSDSGVLSVGHTPLKVGDVIVPSSLDSLFFSSCSDAPAKTGFTLGVESCGLEYSVICNISILDRLNFAPVCAPSPTLSAFSGVSSHGFLKGYDGDSEDLTFEIVSYTKKGTLTLVNAKKGHYVYTPRSTASGSDFFEYVIKDGEGNRSEVSRVEISLDTLGQEDVYSDMHLSPSAYCATVLSRLDIFTGERQKGSLVFSPNKNVDLETFLMMSMSYAGISTEKSGEYPYYRTALSLGILPIALKDLSPDSVPSVAEASGIIEGILRPGASLDEYVFSPEVIPEESYERLVMAYPSLFHLENAPNTPLSRASAVSLVVNCIPRN